jgi:hypothetical protein
MSGSILLMSKKSSQVFVTPEIGESLRTMGAGRKHYEGTLDAWLLG